MSSTEANDEEKTHESVQRFRCDISIQHYAAELLNKS